MRRCDCRRFKSFSFSSSSSSSHFEHEDEHDDEEDCVNAVTLKLEMRNMSRQADNLPFMASTICCDRLARLKLDSRVLFINMHS